jgi:hypothetical protein
VFNLRLKTGTVKPGEPMKVERQIVIGAYRRLNYVGRLYVNPKPELPNPEGVWFKESWHPILEPFDLRGVGATFYRYLNPQMQDDSWIYLPQLRRHSNLRLFQRSDSLFGQDIDADSWWGYNGHPAWMNFRLMGQSTILAPVHARHVPPRWQEPEDWLFEDVWEPRRVWVVEAKSKSAAYAYGKRFLYVDQESWMIPVSDMYDRDGQLWKTWVSLIGFSKSSRPGAKVSVYEDEMPFIHAAAITDVQRGHATTFAIPDETDPANEGWYLNMGKKAGVKEEFFTVADLINAERDPKSPTLPGTD